ncbi:MAG: hypothetical protein WB729_03210 [Candidatus Sulfotelmatobacter sp.]
MLERKFAEGEKQQVPPLRRRFAPTPVGMTIWSVERKLLGWGENGDLRG